MGGLLHAGYGVPIVNFKGFMVVNAQVNWNVVKKIYKEGDPSLPLLGHEHTCLFHWYVSMVKVIQRNIKAFVLSTLATIQGLQR